MSKAFIAIWLIILTIVALCIRVWGAGRYYYNEDELLIMGITQAESLKQLLQFYLYETHPPQFYDLMHYWIKI